jgi:hypothetical protein
VVCFQLAHERDQCLVLSIGVAGGGGAEFPGINQLLFLTVADMLICCSQAVWSEARAGVSHVPG